MLDIGLPTQRCLSNEIEREDKALLSLTFKIMILINVQITTVFADLAAKFG